MAYSKTRAQYEASLASAHRALYRAQGYADELGDEAAYDTLFYMLNDIGQLGEASLTGLAKRLSRYGIQLKLTDQP